MVHFSVEFLCVIFSIGFAQLNVGKRKFITTKDRRIIPTSTTVIQQMTRSPAVCASFCSINETCCFASYDTKTMQCNLDTSCFPESEMSADALLLKKSKVSLSCPNGWLKNENKCYYFNGELKTWKDAKIACKEDGGMLVEVDSQSENNFLKGSASESSMYSQCIKMQESEPALNYATCYAYILNMI
ncbi:Hypothetical predicted protein [Mytilus galloprovincialis]|uniref:Apple domain-containing protein n=1 Tax=Mytilus galloprovincialis TaxID=29158 RepID=A0A8B6FAL5_MYTGA|nr:Hypothetical predicted protein [Mytilus galloprovincialis]